MFKNSSYCSIEETQITSLKFLAAALIKEIPPISIFSIISCSGAPLATVFSKGYKSTITISISGISNSANCALSPSLSLRLKIPPNTFGCKVLTRPPKIDGYEVMSSTATQSIPKSLMNFSVPPVV